MPKKKKSVNKKPIKARIPSKIDYKEIKYEKPKKSRLRRTLKIIWFSFGILDLIWTLIWLIYSLNQKDLYSLASVVFFAGGFYVFCFFILITLFYYIIKTAIKISKTK